jgi:hypothetical protein
LPDNGEGKRKRYLDFLDYKLKPDDLTVRGQALFEVRGDVLKPVKFFGLS